jgi:hypothetical protein
MTTVATREHRLRCARCAEVVTVEATGIKAAETAAVAQGWRWVGPAPKQGAQWTDIRLHCPGCARRITHVETLEDGRPLRELIDRGPASEVHHIDDARGVRLASRWGASSVFGATEAGQLRMRQDVREGLWPK